ncbi:MAG: ACT domain-containing protein [bacterium]|nr:ACT domain-containing protein [bacterium]
MNLSAAELLRSAKVAVVPETFALVGMTRAGLLQLLGDNSLSPRMSAPFMIFMDPHEVTLILDEIDLGNMRPGLGSARVENGYRMLTFNIVLDLAVVGFMAEISRILADAGIPILPLSAFSRDSLLIKQNDLSTALKALGPYVDEVC